MDIYGFTATLCEGKRLGYTNELVFSLLKENIINFYRNNLETFAYSTDFSTSLYRLMDLNKLNQVCKRLKDFR